MATKRGTRMTSLQHSSATIAYVESISGPGMFQIRNWKNCSQQCNSHSRHSHVCSFIAKPVMKQRRSFLILSWVVLHHGCNHSSWEVFHVRDYRSYFGLPFTLSLLNFRAFLIRGTFHPRRWS